MTMWRFCLPWKFNENLYDFTRAVEELVLNSFDAVVTKTHGRLNGYCKVLKTTSVLYVGIDDWRQDIGTKLPGLAFSERSLLRISLAHRSVSKKQKPNLWLIFTISDAFFYGVFAFLDLRNANINSRLVSKGPIHKLLNNIAMSFDSASDIEKQNRSQIYPLFLLNLNCPRSLYDLTLEPSKTSVEFKEGDETDKSDKESEGDEE
ncbi:hypothetical protein H5410_046675 [Solanum commersonii]|uniref:Uncharacterized protein n=1 Tax=Solanum commersonii TaxID=4109 RepID=A0A9J5XCX8_SOLCO|nr:hypothetical protein H5410_046675 [Solanum commersonii]